MANRMKDRYVAEIAPALNKKFGYKSVMQIPKLDKVIVNVGCGESKNNAKEIEAICKDIATITGHLRHLFQEISLVSFQILLHLSAIHRKDVEIMQRLFARIHLLLFLHLKLRNR